jgi:capsid protein
MSEQKNWKNLFGLLSEPTIEQPIVEKPTIEASRGSGSWVNGYAVSFNGEKNVGEIGPIVDYSLNHNALARRSWQFYVDSGVVKTVVNRFKLWIICNGLKLKANPTKILLESEGITIDTEKFNDIVEARFSSWSNSVNSSYSGNTNINELAKDAFKQAKIGGDVLVVLRLIKKVLKVELIDTRNLIKPFDYDVPGGNKIVNGIEINESTKEHIAFHVRTDLMKSTRISAKNSMGIQQAFLVYGDKNNVDDQRGVPLIMTALETVKKLERYQEATLGSAEERAKIVYSIEHEMGGSGESPLVNQLASAFNNDGNSNGNIPSDANGSIMANTVATSTNKQVFNMPIGGSLKALESRNELSFKDFFEAHTDLICAIVNIPPNVAFSKYNDSFSASRAATKDWENTIIVERANFNFQFYQKIYAFWLTVEIGMGKIIAPGYLNALNNKNWMILEAYQCARFTGPMFPHIDPLKEVKAEREKLGELGKYIPLTTIESATEMLNSGDSDSNMEQFSEELAIAKGLNLVAPIISVPVPDPKK